MKKPPLIFPKMRLPFILLLVCFAAWGVAANMTDPLVKVFSQIFTMSSFQSALVQFSYYGAYFCLAIPAAFINKRYSYKTGVLTGLGLAIIGAFLFYPASQSLTYGYFLTALFILAGGLSILETSASPYVISMGPSENATKRLNFAQSFNPIGTNIGVFLAASLILPNLNPATAQERIDMSVTQLTTIQTAELNAVMTPYVGMALLLLLIWLAIAITKAPSIHLTKIHPKINLSTTFTNLFKNVHYKYGVIAQFFNMAAQTCVWTFTIRYVMNALSTDTDNAGTYLQYSMITFLLSRFAMTWLMGFIKPTILLVLSTIVAASLSIYMMYNPTIYGVWALVAISACMSLMFPTIYGIALQGLKKDTQFGAAGLVMAMLGGALIPMVQGLLIDQYGVAFSYIIPAICFIAVTCYALFDLNTIRTDQI
ncbi:L-fucose:H+ symporter permease [Shewanella surugensis]|uniref:L-fucose:H+ symporter permease n=1 Tax=Shewanella surugensis TaxID=212020 RepID=A0ABT0LBW5_9GAMM|nr:L-fucose:H+ symporter permease [Shewanella surugensis]MCL1125168.1 L-fucose:H+ symporter permease [Shewanella surugensis]